jgi:hypothetical protein
MADAGYTFLPWARRGLVAEITAPDDGRALPARATTPVTVTVENAGRDGVTVTMLGPGDVMGLDPRLVVRTEPRPNTTAFEPNYLAAIDFDPPDLPWQFTPAGPSGDRLRPWLALVVVERQPGVTVGMEAGSPLPVLRIDPPADATVELPTLNDVTAWTLWAHGQALADAAVTPAALADELTARPNANVSRLVCPRHLAPGRDYVACVVPTFDAGRIRGLGGEPDPDEPLGPAWTDAHVARLPVYFHWTFATGPAGDFESLAARLRPYASSPRVGRARMHIGDALPPVVDLPDGDSDAVVDMDGALRAPANDDLRTEEIEAGLRAGLAAVVNATSMRAEGGESSAPAVGPPLYGDWHTNRHSLESTTPEWLLDLNVDPRARVAAGLGAEVVRGNQEELMHAAWLQVGDVLEANRRLNAARLSLEAARRVHVRHLRPLDVGRLAALTAPVHGHTLVGAVTVPAAVRATSLPDAVVDAALRRQASSQRPMLRAASRRIGVARMGATLVARLAPGVAAVDPNRFVPNGILAMSSLASVAIPADPTAAVSLEPLGIAGGDVVAGTLMTHRDRATRLSGADRRPVVVKVRDSVRRGGLVDKVHVRAVEQVPGLDGGTRGAVLRQLGVTAAAKPGAAAFVLSESGGRFVVDALDVDAAGNVLVRTRPDRPPLVVVTLDPAARAGPGGVSGALGRLPAGTIDVAGENPVTVGGRVDGRVVVHPPPRPPTRPGHPLPPLVTDTQVIGRFEEAVGAAVAILELDAPVRLATVVAFDLGRARDAILERTDPDRTVLARAASRIRIGDAVLDRASSPLGIKVAPTFDRVLAAPTFEWPASWFLARYDRARFCPGIDEVPPDSVTLLETNPRFVEAFLVGLNHEVNRELVWRSYPTDQRGTTFRRFWDRLDDGDDIGGIHQFGDGAPLGGHLRDPRPKLVLLVRGELLRRYPTAAVYAVRSTTAGRMSTDPADVAHPVFTGSFDPDVTYVGFDLEDSQLDEGDGWFFVIQEQPTEPRFGFDETPRRSGDRPADWLEAAWIDTGTPAGAHLTPAALDAVGLGSPGHAGAVAAALFQRPMRVAVHARRLVQA